MPSPVEAEFRANHDRFKPVVEAGLATSKLTLSAYDERYLESYKLLCAFRGWHEIALSEIADDVAGFFIEAHNDLLTAHLLATNGMWRPSYISLRAFMESYLSFIYFKDHPVEFRLWSKGKFKLEPKDMRSYCASHPDVAAHAVSRAAAQNLGATYSKLSGSVHASRVDFRMTGVSGYPALSLADPVKLNKWLAQEREVVRQALIILVALNASRLRGAAHPLFRKVVAACLTANCKSAIRGQLAVSL